MIEDQRYILNAIKEEAVKLLPNAILISGDVFDKGIPSLEALNLFDDFLISIVKQGIGVYIISGNHDSPDRLNFGSSMFDLSGVHIRSRYEPESKPYIIEDDVLSINIYMLPFMRLISLRSHLMNTEISNYNDAIGTIIDDMNIDTKKINILLAHQFVTGALTSDSEEYSIGSLDNIDADVFSSFDYVALGHLHRPQYIAKETIRYCGSPLKYSFSEVKHNKSITLVEIANKNKISITEIPLKPIRDMNEIRGSYLEVSSREFWEKLNTVNYFKVTLTDEEDQPEVLNKLRIIYPNIMYLEYDNKRTRMNSNVMLLNTNNNNYSPLELFEMLYLEQNGDHLSNIQKDYMLKLTQEIFEEGYI